MFSAQPVNRHNQQVEWLFRLLFGIMLTLLIIPVLLIIATLFYRGGASLTLEFLFTFPSDGMTAGGVFPALLGTIWLVVVSLLASVPLGVAAAIYLS